MMSYLGRISQRLGPLQVFFSSNRDFSVTWSGAVKDICKLPCTRIGPKFIEQIDDDGEYLSVEIRTVSARLFWPRALPMFDLCKVVTECFYEDDWHFYEIQETQVSPGDVVLDCGGDIYGHRSFYFFERGEFSYEVD